MSLQSGNGHVDDRAKLKPIFQATNHHSDSSGNPPHVNADAPGKYYGYFQNEHSEQAIFIYNYETRTGTLWMGDYGWEKPVDVVDGDAPELILSAEERMWLQACWNAATTFAQK